MVWLGYRLTDLFQVLIDLLFFVGLLLFQFPCSLFSGPRRFFGLGVCICCARCYAVPQLTLRSTGRQPHRHSHHPMKQPCFLLFLSVVRCSPPSHALPPRYAVMFQGCSQASVLPFFCVRQGYLLLEWLRSLISCFLALHHSWKCAICLSV